MIKIGKEFLFIVSLCGFLFFTSDVMAMQITPPVGVDSFSFPDKLYSFNENIPLSFNVFNNSFDGKKHSEKIIFSLQPWKRVNPNSQSDGVEILLNNEPLTFSKSGEFFKSFSLTDRETKPVKLDVFVKKDGEYMFSIKYSEYNSQTYFIVTKDKKVCVAGGNWDSCVWRFLMDENKLSLNLVKNQLPFFLKDKIVDEYKKIIHERQIKEELYDKEIVVKLDAENGEKVVATSTDVIVKESFWSKVADWFSGFFRK